MSSRVIPCPQNITPHKICSDLAYSLLSPSKPSSWSLPSVAVFPFLCRAIYSCPPFESAVYPSAQQIQRLFWEPTVFKRWVVNPYKSWLWLSVACWALNACPRQVEGNPKGLSSQLWGDLENCFPPGTPIPSLFPFPFCQFPGEGRRSGVTCPSLPSDSTPHTLQDPGQSPLAFPTLQSTVSCPTFDSCCYHLSWFCCYQTCHVECLVSLAML